MHPWLNRLRSYWHRVFFWQDVPPAGSSEEFHPHHWHDHALVLSVTGPRKIPRWKQLRFINRVLPPAERRWFWLSVLVFFVALGIGIFGLGKLNFEAVPA